jgi:hypothetical protein
VRSAVGAHSALLIELVSNAEAAIDTKNDDISALHRASKSALTKAIALCNGPALNRRALAMVDNAMTAAVAPGGLMDQRISKVVTLAVIATVDNIVAREIQPHVEDTLDKIFISYRDCVIVEQHMAENDLAESFHVQRALATTDFQDFVTHTTSTSIDVLDAALCSAEKKFEPKRNSVVEAITTAHRNPNSPTPVPRTPSRTSLEIMTENTTPVGATKVAWADSQIRRQPTPTVNVPAPMPSPPVFANPSPPPRITCHGCPLGSHPAWGGSPQSLGLLSTWGGRSA